MTRRTRRDRYKTIKPRAMIGPIAQSKVTYRDAYEAGPPCAGCYSWSKPFFGNWSWKHDVEGEGDDVKWRVCRHGCHGDDGFRELNIVVMCR